MLDFEETLDEICQIGCFQCQSRYVTHYHDASQRIYEFHCGVCGKVFGTTPIVDPKENLTVAEILAGVDKGQIETRDFNLPGCGMIIIQHEGEAEWDMTPIHTVMTDEELLAEFYRLADGKPVDPLKSLAAHWDQATNMPVLVLGTPNRSVKWYLASGLVPSTREIVVLDSPVASQVIPF